MVDSGQKRIDSLRASLIQYKKLKEDRLANEKELDIVEAEIKLSCLCPVTSLVCDRLQTKAIF